MISVDISKKLTMFDGPSVLNVRFEIPIGSMAAILGPSGAGKTTLLRIIAGLIPPTKGRVEFDGASWTDTEKNIFVKPQHRPIGFVFQDYALFPNMTVRENLEFAVPKNNLKDTGHALEMMEIGALAEKRPANLSGGQKQRVALARAIVRQPKLLLLDEPLSALDRDMKIKMRDFISRVHKEYGLTTLIVSHDIENVSQMTDRVIKI